LLLKLLVVERVAGLVRQREVVVAAHTQKQMFCLLTLVKLSITLSARVERVMLAGRTLG
jgi:hypothetical protein